MVTAGDVVKLVAKETVAFPAEKVQQKTGCGEQEDQPGKRQRFRPRRGGKQLVADLTEVYFLRFSWYEQFGHIDQCVHSYLRRQANSNVTLDHSGAIVSPQSRSTEFVSGARIDSNCSRWRSFALLAGAHMRSGCPYRVKK